MWCKLVKLSEDLPEGGLRHEEYVRQDLAQVIHTAHAMVGMYDGLFQIGNLVLQLSSCGIMV